MLLMWPWSVLIDSLSVVGEEGGTNAQKDKVSNDLTVSREVGGCRQAKRVIFCMDITCIVDHLNA